MSDIKLGDSNFSLDLTNGTFKIIEGQDASIQALRMRLTAFTEEWFLDQAVGLPYFTQILIRGVNEAAVYQLYRDAILATPGVTEVEALEIGIGDSDNRVMTITAQVVTETGESITIETGV